MLEEVLNELRLIRSEQTEQGKLLVRVDERTLALDEKVEAHLSADDKFHGGIEKRVNTLEHWRTRAAAVVGFVGLVAGAFAGAIKYAVAHIFWPN
jgi:hypothetical protein